MSLSNKNICIYVLSINWFSSEFLINLFKNILETSGYKENIRFIIVDNTVNKDKNILRLPEIFSDTPVRIVPNHNAEYKIASQSHASGLNVGFNELISECFESKKNLEEYILIVDPDIYIFKKEWDKILIGAMKNNGLKIAGTTYPPWQLGKYHDFPNPVFLFAEKQFLADLHPDWMCYDENTAHRLFNILCLLIVRGGYFVSRRRFLKYPSVASCFSRIEKYLPVCSLETGYKLRNSADKNISLLLKPVCYVEKEIHSYNTQTPEQQKALQNLAQNFELYLFNGEPFLTHRYSSCAELWKTEKCKDCELWNKCITGIHPDI